jgi:ACT domain-containing protein
MERENCCQDIERSIYTVTEKGRCGAYTLYSEKYEREYSVKIKFYNVDKAEVGDILELPDYMTIMDQGKPMFSNKLLQLKVNIEDIKQTIMQNNFAMMMLCDISKLEVSFKEFKDAMMALGEELGMEIWVQKKDIFDKMHTV